MLTCLLAFPTLLLALPLRVTSPGTAGPRAPRVRARTATPPTTVAAVAAAASMGPRPERADLTSLLTVDFG